MFIDTHAHLNFKAFKKDLPVVLDRAKEAAVAKIIIPGAKIDSSKRAIEVAQKYDSCYAAIGVHPHHVKEYTSLLYSNEVKSVKETLEQLVRENKVVAIGEVGLDYYEYKGYPPITTEAKIKQKELLMLQIDIAQEFNLPLILHCRDAYDDMLETITSYIQSTDKKPTGVFHCFGGEKKHLEKIHDLGFYVGFDGNITYPENENLRDLVKYTPIDKLLLETDAPYLTPLPYRGQRNEPAYLTKTATCIGNIHDKTISDIATITTHNALKLFRLQATDMVK